MKMKRTALFFASTAILFSSPLAMAEQPPLNRPFISSNSNVPSLMLAQAEEALPQEDSAAEEIKRKAGKRAEKAQERAAEEADAAAKAQQQAEKQAKQQADQAAKAAEAESAQKADEAQRAAQAEADKAAEQQKAVEEKVKRKAASESKAAKAAEKEAAQEAEKAKRAAEAESNKAAEQQKAIEEEARKKAASEAEAAKAAEQDTAKEAAKAKKAAEQEAAKAAKTQKATEEEARKKADGAQKAADKQTEKAADDAKKAMEAAQEAPAKVTPETPATAEKPAPDQTTGEKPAVTVDETKPVKPANPATGQPTPEGTATAPATAPAEATQPAQQEASPLPENAAPVLDSDKPAPVREGKNRSKGSKGGQAAEAPAAARPVAQEPATPPAPAPTTDAEVQQQLTPVKIEPVLTEKGTRTKDRRRDERPADVQVIKQFDDRTIVEVNNNVFVESSDRPRMSRNAQEVYYEDLPRRRTRETIVRDNGVQIITIRNRYGDVIQRSRVMPDGREVLLTYTPDYDREDRLEWRDPGDDLPPLRLNIPVRDYIMDAEEAPEEDVYEFFAQPPVERVERIYSVDEVKRSARIRDKVRRVDLDTITFQFGSAEIGEDQIERIESVANAMSQVLKKNPAETFLIEGHTDAVGSDQANLVLSDKRAESVAQALTNVFDIPPENMATQGYGERYLKIKADGPEQQNRRVAIRRITPLVAPMASNN
jgi:outer membrane protein OmpA-like peptidoglycan-associated protein